MAERLPETAEDLSASVAKWMKDSSPSWALDGLTQLTERAARLSAAEQERERLWVRVGEGHKVVTALQQERDRLGEALAEEAVHHTQSDYRARAAEARAEAADKLLTWLDVQLVGCLDYADAVAAATGLPNARALRGDLVDARVAVRAALAGREETGGG